MSGMELLLQAAERSGAWDRDPSPPPPVAPAGPPTPAVSRSEDSRGSSASLPLKKRMKLGGRHDCGLSVVSAGSASAFDVVGSRTESPPCPAINSVWADPEALGRFVDDLPVLKPRVVKVKQPVKISPAKWRTILETVSSVTVKPVPQSGKSDGKANAAGKSKTKTKAGRSSRPRKRKAAPLVKDMDGNDVGMGYFSAIPTRNTVSPVAEGPAAPASPPPLNLEDASAEESSVGAESAASTPVERENQDQGDTVATAKKMLFQAYLSALNQTGKG